jgi:putative tryptophan/tyrosine transport system substrate-binding protein
MTAAAERGTEGAYVYMRRREFISLLGGAAVAWPLTASAQQPATPVIGVLISYSLDRSGQRLLSAFREGLRESGYEDGRNVAIEYRSAEGQYDRLPALAADLVRRRSAVIAAVGGSPAALAAKLATTSLPIVFQVGVDPVEAGLVASLSRPGGNLTGVANLAVEVGPKRLELLRELVPTASDIAVLFNPTRSNAEAELRDLHGAANVIGIKLHALEARTDNEFETVFANVIQLRAGGLVISGDPFFNSRSEQLAALAMRHGIPAVYQFHEFAAAGGLISYGSSITNTHRLAGIYTGRILKGEKPADLPVQQSTKVELIINLKTAKAFGLDVPPTLLARADEVIE